MKRASVCLVVLLFVVSLVSSAGSSSGRTLNATEAAALWGGDGTHCYNGDDNCEASDHCEDHVWEAACELAEEQEFWPGPKFKCIYWPFNDVQCVLNDPVVCVKASACFWDPIHEVCYINTFDAGWDDKFTHSVCNNVPPAGGGGGGGE